MFLGFTHHVRLDALLRNLLLLGGIHVQDQPTLFGSLHYPILEYLIDTW